MKARIVGAQATMKLFKFNLVVNLVKDYCVGRIIKEELYKTEICQPFVSYISS